MKVDISKFVVVAAIAALLVVGGSAAAWAQCPTSPNYVSNFNADQACLKQNGSSAFFTPVEQPTILRLTTAGGGQAGSAWFTGQQPVAGGFSTTFKFQFTAGSNPPADGIAF